MGPVEAGIGKVVMQYITGLIARWGIKWTKNSPSYESSCKILHGFSPFFESIYTLKSCGVCRRDQVDHCLAAALLSGTVKEGWTS